MTDMKRQLSIIMAALVATVASAQMKLDNSGDIFFGSDMTKQITGSVNINGYNGLLWKAADGSQKFKINFSQYYTHIKGGTNNKLFFYDRQTNEYNTIHLSDLWCMGTYDGSSVLPNGRGLGDVLGLSPAASQSGDDTFTASSLRDAAPELTVTDPFGNRMVDMGSMLALMVASLQNLQAQADAQQAEIEALRGQAKSKKAGKGQLQDVEGIHSSQVISNNSDTPKYDLQGRRVESPKQGEIYIQKGKKTRK